MSVEDEADYLKADVADVGLDRARIHRHQQIELPQQLQAQGEHDILATRVADESADSERRRSASHPHLSAINDRRHDAADKLKQVLRIKKKSDDDDTPEPNPQSSVLAKPAEAQTDFSMKRSIERAKRDLSDKETRKAYLHHPLNTVKDKISTQGSRQVAENIAAKEIPHEQEKEIIEAHDAVQRAQSDTEKLLAIEDLEGLLKERQTTFVRWTLDRHVSKVRVLPRETFQLKPRSDFRHREMEGKMSMDWNAYAHHLLMYYAHQYGGQYIGYGSSPPSPSKNNIVPNLERLLIASAPFQELGMTIRRVYRWENPSETVKYMIIYLILWYLDLIPPGILSALLYFVVERYIHGNTLKDLREDIKHTEDQQRSALSLAEFIEKRGDEHWADDAIEVLGPWLMIQLADLANGFEAIRNFYEWRVPHRTVFTLTLLVITILAITFTPLWLQVKVAGLAFGAFFFIAWPIATNYPDYRLLLSPIKRIFWNIPTHAEWAIKSLQAEGSRFEREESCEPSNPSADDDAMVSRQHYVFGSFAASYEKRKGQLGVQVESVLFETKAGPIFDLRYSEIQRLEKVNRRVGRNLPKPSSDTGEDLKIVSKAGEEWVLASMEQRDLAFSQIIGFSETTWQVVW